ncbi:unnamed protein product, partial [Mesorhabditis spiculigera]
MHWLSVGVLAVLASSALGCRYKGNSYVNNETWEEKGAFRMKCIIESNGSWRTDVVGCLTPDGVEVPVKGKKSIGEHEWSCEQTADGHITLKQELGKNADCPGGHKRGDTWTEKSFEFRCDEGGQQKFVGCVTNTGVKIANGQSKELPGGMVVECKMFPNGTVSMNGVGKKADANCVDTEGKQHRVGEKWVQGKHFQMECKPHGETKMSGCVLPDGGVIAIDSVLTKGTMEYHCEMKGGALKFYSKPKNN